MRKADTFAARLKSLRTRAGLSQAALATAAGFERQAVYQWESGRRQPTLDAAVRLAVTLGCPIGDLAGCA